MGVDAETVSFSFIQKLRDKEGIQIVATEGNLVDQVWGEERPKLVPQPIFHLDLRYAGRSFAEKLANLRKDLKHRSGILLTALDEVACT